MGQIRGKIESFTLSYYFIVLIGFLSFLAWINNFQAFILSLFIVITFLILILFEDVTPVIPIIISFLFISKEPLSFSSIPWWLILLPILLCISIIIHFIKYKKQLRITKFGFSIIILFISTLFSLVNVDYNVVDYKMIFLAFSGALYCFLYFFFYCSKINRNTLNYLSFTMMIFGLLISAQIFTNYVIYLNKNLGISTIICNTLDLGWGIENDACIYLNVAICFSAYLMTKLKNFFVPAILVVIDIFAILMTGSRGGIASLGILIIGIIIIQISSSKNKQWAVSNILVMTSVCILGIHILFNPLDEFIKCVSIGGVSLNGRENLYKLAIDNLMKYPLFGSSIFAGIDSSNRLIVYHSFIFQSLGSFGIIGFMALIYAIIIEYYIILKSNNPFKWFFFLLITVGLIHGVLDNIFYMIIYMIITYITFAIYEKDYIEIDKQFSDEEDKINNYHNSTY